jgi:aromatic-L-amino-acid decarboxylase
MCFCRYRDAVAEAFRAEVSYMPKKPDGSPEDPYTTSAQWCRRLIGLKLFLALAELGESGYVEMIDH